ncbi:MAG: UvrD-helicase domain-containing protein [Phocaeicola sp.]|uniref:UvrD-helicase domain-containing protein n=1 Tax=Phocaeicola sp. TaxID=2773926 RepID=UPI003FA01FCC
MHSNLLVYKASAGSGKTFTLTVEYIKLLIDRPENYKEILAVTFTNKATTEMKERILSQLYGIAIGDSLSDAYLNVILSETNRSVDAIRQQAKRALKLIIHDYSHFHIETIDSFFQSVIKNIARELNLGANLKIILDQEKPLSDAVDTIINNLNTNDVILTWITDFIMERINNDKSWNVSKEIKSFGKYIFNEIYIEKGDNVKKNMEEIPHFIGNYKKLLNALSDDAEKELTDIADKFFKILNDNGLEPTDLNGGTRSIASYFNKLKALALDKLINSTVEKCLDSPENWASKTSKRRNEIVSLADSTLLPLLKKAESVRPKDESIINSCNLSLRYVNDLQLLSTIDDEIHEENRTQNRFLLSDTNALLRKFVANEDSPFIFEKLGASLNHIMIDEFQDTSRMQWNNFKFLLQNGLAQGKNSLIVGDVKQSIYRWRNGDWRILNNLKNTLFNFPIIEKHLNVNRRSYGNIVRFNNAFFTKVLECVNNNDENLRNAYKDVRQEVCKHPDEGFVHVCLLHKDNYEKETCNALKETVNTLIDKGIHQKDIAILVRKKKFIPIIANYFNKNTHYQIVSDEAFQLNASSAINMMINALRLLFNPEDKIAKAQLALSYQIEILKNGKSMNEILLSKNNSETFLPEKFLKQMNELRLMPLYELLEKLFKLFDMSKIEKQDAYLCAFFDNVMQYIQENSSDIGAFLDFWDEELYKKAIPSGEVEGIRILSVHSSKGLEFHTVLLPFCDWAKENEINYDNVIWVEPKEAPYNELDILPVEYSKPMEKSIYADDYSQEQYQLWVDNLNLLYVAFTRAESNLFIYSQKGIMGKDKMSNTANISDWIQSTLGMLTVEDNPEIKLNVVNDGSTEDEPLIYEYGSIVLTEKKKEQNTENKLLTPAMAQEIHLKSYDSNIEFKQSNKSAEFINGEATETEKYISEGRLMHHVFSAIYSKSDVDKAIAQLRFDGIIESAEQEEHVRKLTLYALNNPKVQDWYSGNWTLYNECTILYNKNGEIQTRRPDRVMIKDGEVVVVDFKFGIPREEYHHQVNEYIGLLKQMGYTNIKGYLWYIFDNQLEEVEQAV